MEVNGSSESSDFNLIARVGEDKTRGVGYFFHMLVIDTSFSHYSVDFSTVPA